MLNQNISNYFLPEDAGAFQAFYYLQKFKNHRIILVRDDTDKTVGILTPGDFTIPAIIPGDYASSVTGAALKNDGFDALNGVTVGEICNRNFKYIPAGSDIYKEGRNIFGENGLKILDIPIIDEMGCCVGILARWQAFYKEYYETGRLLRMIYAEPIMNAARLARKKGYSEISVVEFGVAGGTGLILAELYARETEHLTGVKIDVWGFDLGSGLPELKPEDFQGDFISGEYPMDIEKLRGSLSSARLVLGDIRETTRTFFEEYNPPPIGTIFVDVDLYSPTTAILEMLRNSDEHFLPVVYMYFDDINPTTEFEGEAKAIKEFNRDSKDIKIVPEGLSPNYMSDFEIAPAWRYRSKSCLRYSHPKFMDVREGIRHLDLNL